MHFIVLCLGVLSSAYLGECAVTGWTSPTQVTADGTPTGAILTLAEGYTGDLFTFVATTGSTSITTYAFKAQTPDDGIFAIAASTGVLTIASTKVLDYEASTSYKLEVTATDDTSTGIGTTTVTIALTNVAPVFIATKVTIEVPDATASGTAFAIVAAVDVGATLAYAITAAGNTNTDFTISSTTGVVSTANALAVGTTSSYTLEITAADNVATILTGTATLVVCVGTCPGSGAAGLAAGILSLITLAVTMLK